MQLRSTECKCKIVDREVQRSGLGPLCKSLACELWWAVIHWHVWAGHEQNCLSEQWPCRKWFRRVQKEAEAERPVKKLLNNNDGVLSVVVRMGGGLKFEGEFPGRTNILWYLNDTGAMVKGHCQGWWVQCQAVDQHHHSVLRWLNQLRKENEEVRWGHWESIDSKGVFPKRKLLPSLVP